MGPDQLPNTPSCLPGVLLSGRACSPQGDNCNALASRDRAIGTHVACCLPVVTAACGMRACIVGSPSMAVLVLPSALAHAMSGRGIIQQCR